MGVLLVVIRLDATPCLAYYSLIVDDVVTIMWGPRARREARSTMPALMYSKSNDNQLFNATWDNYTSIARAVIILMKAQRRVGLDELDNDVA